MLKRLIDGKRVALIGPSPHLINKKLGKYIDSFDIVVRINELGVANDCYEDYGSKTDIAFLTLTKEAIPVYKKMIFGLDIENLKMVVSPRDEFNTDTTKNFIDDKNSFEYFQQLPINNIEFFQVSKPPPLDVYKLFNCFPSTGSLTIFELLKYDFKELFICGFSFFTTKYKYNSSRKIYELSNPLNNHKHNIRISGHAVDYEIKFLKSLISNTDKNISYDKLFKNLVISDFDYYKIKHFLNMLNMDSFKNYIKIFINKITNFE